MIRIRDNNAVATLVAGLLAGGSLLPSSGTSFAQEGAFARNELPAEVRVNGEFVGYRIVGGSIAAAGAWPSMVSMYYKPFSASIPFCGAAIIDPNWAITAAHCVHRRKGEDFFIREGANLAGQGRRIDVRAVKMHESYDPEHHLNDVALLSLSGPSQSPRQLMVSNARMPELLPDRQKATVIGYGTVSQGGQSSQKLLYVDLPVVAKPRCQSVYGPQNITDATLCAGLDEGGKDSCQGDSGGPIFVRDELNQVVQVGVVSWGEGCAQPRKYGVYASLGYFENWIKRSVPNASFLPLKTVAPAQTSTNVVLTSFVGSATQPGLTAQVSVDVQPGEQVKVGDKITVRVTSSVAGNLVVYNQDIDGRAYQIFPNKFTGKDLMPGQSKTKIEAGETVVVPGPMDAFALRITPPAGKNRMIAVVVPPEVKIDDIAQKNQDMDTIIELDTLLQTIAAREVATRGVSVEAAEPKRRAVGVRDYQIIQ